MEMMDKENKISSSKGFSSKLLIALLFILFGVLLFARNLGWITGEQFNLIVAWHSLFIIVGIYLIRYHLAKGIILLLLGIYFLTKNMNLLPVDSLAVVYPLIFVMVGILLFLSHYRKPRMMKMHERHHRMWKERMENMQGQQQSESENGFLSSENKFGAARHVVLDEEFKGATVYISFGGTILDLRHTKIAAGETYIDVDCNCGGLEIYVPSDWKVVMKCNAFFGGCEDKRWQNGNFDKERTLVIRGKLSFGGLEIKD